MKLIGKLIKDLQGCEENWGPTVLNIFHISVVICKRVQGALPSPMLETCELWGLFEGVLFFLKYKNKWREYGRSNSFYNMVEGSKIWHLMFIESWRFRGLTPSNSFSSIRIFTETNFCRNGSIMCVKQSNYLVVIWGDFSTTFLQVFTQEYPY